QGPGGIAYQVWPQAGTGAALVRSRLTADPGGQVLDEVANAVADAVADSVADSVAKSLRTTA
ncbi:carboxylesterase, partial [Streptomyces sp. SID7499]|nr:carboxylesterase [Streptomyces sp. SID7499]